MNEKNLTDTARHSHDQQRMKKRVHTYKLRKIVFQFFESFKLNFLPFSISDAHLRSFFAFFLKNRKCQRRTSH